MTDKILCPYCGKPMTVMMNIGKDYYCLNAVYHAWLECLDCSARSPNVSGFSCDGAKKIAIERAARRGKEGKLDE